METIDNRVRDILRVKFLTGLFDTPYQTDLALADKEVNSEAHQQVALQASREGLVLLRNANNLLPLDKFHKSSVLPYVVRMPMKHPLHLPTTVP